MDINHPMYSATKGVADKQEYLPLNIVYLNASKCFPIVLFWQQEMPSSKGLKKKDSKVIANERKKSGIERRKKEI